MEKETQTGIRVGAEWCVGLGAVIALIAGAGVLERLSIDVLVGAGGIAFSCTIFEHGLYKSLTKKGMFAKASVMLLFVWGFMVVLGILVWPKEQLKIARVQPTIVWNEPLAVEADVPLTDVQLNAKAYANGKLLPGDYVYIPAIGSTLASGTQTLSVTFTPKDSVNFGSKEATTTIVVKPKKVPTRKPEPLLVITRVIPTANRNIGQRFHIEIQVKVNATKSLIIREVTGEAIKSIKDDPEERAAFEQEMWNKLLKAPKVSDLQLPAHNESIAFPIDGDLITQESAEYAKLPNYGWYFMMHITDTKDHTLLDFCGYVDSKDTFEYCRYHNGP